MQCVKFSSEDTAEVNRLQQQCDRLSWVGCPSNLHHFCQGVFHWDAEEGKLGWPVGEKGLMVSRLLPPLHDSDLVIRLKPVGRFSNRKSKKSWSYTVESNDHALRRRRGYLAPYTSRVKAEAVAITCAFHWLVKRGPELSGHTVVMLTDNLPLLAKVFAGQFLKEWVRKAKKLSAARILWAYLDSSRRFQTMEPESFMTFIPRQVVETDDFRQVVIPEGLGRHNRGNREAYAVVIRTLKRVKRFHDLVIYTDGSYSNNLGGWAFVVYDDCTSTTPIHCACGIQTFSPATSAFQMEIAAISQALAWVASVPELLAGHVVIVTDCMQVIHMIKNGLPFPDPWRSSLPHVKKVTWMYCPGHSGVLGNMKAHSWATRIRKAIGYGRV